MKREFLIVVAMSFSLLAALPTFTAGANLVSNGDFETVDGEVFSDWDASPSVESASVISGTYSAELQGTNIPTGVDALQNSVEYAPDCTFSVDFACFATSSNTARSFNLALVARPATGTPAAGWTAINFRVVEAGTFQVYNGTTAYESVGLTAVTTEDANGDKIWDGETPEVNHLEIVTHYSDATPTYDVTLNGTTISGFTGFQYNNPAGKVFDYSRIHFMRSDSESDYLIDNMSMVCKDIMPGDANLDGKVDATDAATLASNWLYGVGAENPDAKWKMGDFNGDRQVDDADATLLATNWQYGVTSEAASAPEPSAAVLLITTTIVFLSLAFGRKKR